MQWSAATEREVCGHEVRISRELEAIERLHRQRDREPPRLLDLGAQPELEVGTYMDSRVVVCATCGRDHEAEIGPELLVAGEPKQIVCWPCGFEITPELAAEVLARRAGHAEKDALASLSAAARWLSEHVASMGAGQRAQHFEERCEHLREQLRRMKAAGYTDPDTWRLG